MPGQCTRLDTGTTSSTTLRPCHVHYWLPWHSTAAHPQPHLAQRRTVQRKRSSPQGCRHPPPASTTAHTHGLHPLDIARQHSSKGAACRRSGDPPRHIRGENCHTSWTMMGAHNVAQLLDGHCPMKNNRPQQCNPAPRALPGCSLVLPPGAVPPGLLLLQAPKRRHLCPLAGIPPLRSPTDAQPALFPTATAACLYPNRPHCQPLRRPLGEQVPSQPVQNEEMT